MSAPPPAYSTDTPPSELALPAGATTPLQLSTGDISGLRAQILDNATTLFTLAHGAHRRVPVNFRINSVRAPISEGDNAGRIQAIILSQQGRSDMSTAVVLSVFVQGPYADTTELALRALNEKLEGMLGRKWKASLESEYGSLVKLQQVFLRSIDE